MSGAFQWNERGIVRFFCEALAHFEWHDVVGGSVNEALRDGDGQQLDGRCRGVALRILIGRPAEELADHASGKLQGPSAAKVGDSGQRSDAAQIDRHLGREPQRELAAGGMAGSHDAAKIEAIARGDARDVLSAMQDIVQCAGPAAAPARVRAAQMWPA